MLNEVQKRSRIWAPTRRRRTCCRRERFKFPHSSTCSPRGSRRRWKCEDLPAYSSTEMPFSIALMIVVDQVSRKWIKDDNQGLRDQRLWGERSNCPNPDATRRSRSSRAAAERRLGDRALSSQRLGALALLDAEARRPSARSSSAWARATSIRRCRLPGGRRRRQLLQDRRDPVPGGGQHGKAINGNSVLGHSLEAARAGT